MNEQEFLAKLLQWRGENGIDPAYKGPLDATQLRKLAEDMNGWLDSMYAGPPTAGSKAILYTGQTGLYDSWRVAESLAEHSGGGKYTIADTPLGRLLNSKDLKVGLTQASGSTQYMSDLLGGQVVNGVRTPFGTSNVRSIGDYASQRFVNSTVGDVITITSEIDPNKVFGATELRALIDNPNVSLINGVPRPTFLALIDEYGEVEGMRRARDIVVASSITETATMRVMIGTRSQTVHTILRDVHGEAKLLAMAKPGNLAAYDLGVKVGKHFGHAMEVLSLLGAVNKAADQAMNGDKEGAKNTLLEFGAEFAAEDLGAELASQAFRAFLVDLIPGGRAPRFLAGIAAAIAGGHFTSREVEEMRLFEKVGWNLDDVIQNASLDSQEGVIHRNALKYLDPLAIAVSGVDSTGLELYDPSSGTGTITSDWIMARAQMMMQYAEYRLSGDDDGQLDVSRFRWPAQFGNLVYTDPTIDDLPRLSVDYLDWGLADSNFIRFGSESGETLLGGEEQDMLFGEGGNDTLQGGEDTWSRSKVDYLEGGLGNDRYIYNSGDGQDVILDVGGDDRIVLNGTVLSGTFVATDDPRYPDKSAWTLEDAEEGELLLTLISGDLVDGTLEITGTRLGDEGSITIKHFSNGQFGFDFGAPDSLKGILGKGTFDEESATALVVPIAGSAKPGQVVRFAVGPAFGQMVRLSYDGINHDFDGDGVLELTLDGGERSLSIVLLSQNIAQTTNFSLSAVMLDVAGDPIPGSGQFKPISIVVVDGPTTASQTNTVQGDQEPMRDSHNAIIFDQWGNIIPIGAAPGRDDNLYGTFFNDLLIGGEGTNYYLTTNGNGQDRIIGGSWMDIAIMGTGNDTAIGGNGRDRLAGNWGNDFIYAVDEVTEEYAIARGVLDPNGSGFEDFLAGGLGNDVLIGSASRDVLSGGPGADRLIAGAGDDHILGDVDAFPEWQSNNYDPAPWSVVMTVEPGAGPGGADVHHYNLVNAIVYARPDPDGNDVIYAGAGNDSVLAGGGNDVIYGETGNDEIWGSFGNDLLFGGADNDLLVGGQVGDAGEDDDFLDGGAGNDELYGYSGNDVLEGGAGNDYLQGDADDEFDGVDELNGGDGNDTLLGGGRADLLIGGAGDDKIYGDDDSTPEEMAGTDRIEGNAGNDLLVGFGGADNISGGDGDDEIRGDGSETADAFGDGDVLFGGDGKDNISGGGGNDQIYGGAGDDELYGDASYTPEEFHGRDLIDGGDGDDTIIGNGGADTLLGGDGNDTMLGDGSNVTPVGAHGDDEMDGGAGNDTMQGDGGNDLIFGGLGDDILLGSEGNDILDGGEGADQLQGGEGNDTLYSDNAGDILMGGAGDDTYVITSADGRFRIVDTEGSNRLLLGGGAQRSGTTVRMSGGGVLLVNADNSYSSMSASTFASFASFEYVSGGSVTAAQMHGAFVPGQSVDRNIRLSAGVQASSIQLRARGDDLILVCSSSNVNWFDANALRANNVLFRTANRTEYGLPAGATPVLVLSNWYRSNPSTYVTTVLGSSSSLTLTNYTATLQREFIGDDFENSMTLGSGTFNVKALGGDDTVQTSSGNDILDGGAGNDVLDSGAGSDILTGGAGDDTLVGGSASDEYRYFAGDGADYIIDAEGTEDVLVFGPGILPTDLTITESALGLKIQVGPAANGNSVFVGNSIQYEPSVEAFVFADDTFWDAAEIDAHITGNRAPRSISLLTNSTGRIGELFTRTIPAEVFADPNPGDTLTYSATLANGNPLPAWLTFNPVSRTLSGTPDVSDAAAIQIAIRATDADGLSALNGFTLSVAPLSVVVGTAGNDTLYAGSSNPHSISGLAGNDIIYGSNSVDILTGGPGNDQLQGNLGGDTYIWNRGDGRDQIDGSSADGGAIDTLQFGANIAPSDVRVAQFGNNLLFFVRDPATASERPAVEVLSGVDPEAGPNALDRVRFSDGTTWNRADFLARSLMGGSGSETLIGDSAANVIAGNAGDDILQGNDGDDDLRGGAGRDLLAGGAGNDTYRFARNDGNDEIEDSDGINRIVLDAGILPSEVSLYRESGADTLPLALGQSLSDDLILVLNGGQQQIRVEQYYSAQNPPVVSEIVFGDGTVWNSAAVASRVVNVSTVANNVVGTSGNDNFSVDHSGDTIDEAVGGGTDSVTSTANYRLPDNVENLTLSGMFALMGVGNADANVITGNAFANTLDGGAGTDTLIGGAGDDRYVVNISIHESWSNVGWTNGLDTIVESAGGGYDVVIANTIYSATLPDNVEALVATGLPDPAVQVPYYEDGRRRLVGNALANVIDASGVLGLGSGNELVIDGGAGADLLIGPMMAMPVRYVVDNAADQIVANQFDQVTVETSVDYAVPDFVSRIDLVGSAPIGATGNDLDNWLQGSSNSAANVLTGGRGNDTFAVGVGDTVAELAGEGVDTVRFTQGAVDGSYSVAGFQNIESFALDDALQHASLVGADSDDELHGNIFRNVLRGGAGNDRIYSVSDQTGLGDEGDILVGGSGDDLFISNDRLNVHDGGTGDDVFQGENVYGTIRFGRGYGYDKVVAANSSAELVIFMQPGVVASDLRVAREGYDIHIHVGQTDRLSIGGFFYLPYTSELTHVVSQVVFADGTTLSKWDLQAMAQSVSDVPTGGNDVLNGTSGADRFDGLAGNDTINAGDGVDILVGGDGHDTLRGNAGGDIYRVSPNWSNDVILDTADGALQDGEMDVVEFAAGLTRQNTTFARVANTNDLVVRFTGATGSLTVRNFYATGAASDQIELFRFADGTTVTAGELLQLPVLSGSGAADSLVATAQSMILEGLGGDDILEGNAGADTLDGGIGADQMSGGSGNDQYVVDNTGDAVVELVAGGFDTVESSISFTLGQNLENLTLTGNGAINGTGNSLANTLRGNSAANTLDGAAGADTLFGGDGDDIYRVDDVLDAVFEVDRAGFDTVRSTVSYTLSANVERLELEGSANIDGIGNPDDNTIVGNSGNNTLIGGGGFDTLIGGAGNDIYYADEFDSLVELAGGGIDEIRTTVSMTMADNVEKLTIIGSYYPFPLPPKIQVTGNASNNVITGNAWHNDIDGGAGADTMIGGEGDDAYVVDNVGDIVIENENSGWDTVTSSVSFVLPDNLEWLMLKGSANANATGNEGDNYLGGNDGDNVLDGKGGIDNYFDGGAGNDTYVIDDDLDFIILEGETSGVDTVRSSLTYSISNKAVLENITLVGTGAINATGNSGNNVLTGNDGQNLLSGGSGNDILDGGAGGNDTLNGGQGNDTFIVNRSGLTLQEGSNQGTDTVLSSITFTLSTNFENLTLTGSANINGTGSSGNNTLTGNSGNNLLTGGGGLDTMIGGLGDDTYVVDSTNDIVTEGLNEGVDSVTASVTGYTLANNVENMTLSGSIAAGTGNNLDNVITGNSAANTLNGGDGNDTLNGLGGNDTLNGGNGNDILDGGTGADNMSGGAGDDTYFIDQTGETVTESASSGIDTIVTTFQLTGNLASNVENLTLGGSIVTGTGNTLDNVIIGNAANNTLSGSDGNDTLNGMGGNDNMTGGLGNDIFVVDSTSDVVTEASGGGTDTIQTSVQITTWAANVENMTLLGSGNLTITGTAGANVLIGNSGNNALDGGSGDDTINGGLGTDSITGGLGADTYQYTSGGGADTINNVASDSLIDRLQFTDLASTQIAFSRVGNNLVMTRVGVSTDTVTVTNWFSATANRLDFVNFTNVQKTAAEIDALVSGGGGSFPLSIAPPAAMRAGSALEVGSTFDVWGAWDGSLVAEAATVEDTTLVAKTGSDQAAVLRPIKVFDRSGAITLGEKSASESTAPVLRPIKSFVRDDASVGVDRLIDAMTTFGAERNVGGIHADGVHGEVMDVLAGQHPTRAQVTRAALHTLMD